MGVLLQGPTNPTQREDGRRKKNVNNHRKKERKKKKACRKVRAMMELVERVQRRPWR